MSEQQAVAPPTEVLALVLHENFWWFFQTAQQHVLATLTAPGAIQKLLNAAFKPTDTGLGLGELGAGGCTAVFADGPVKYVNMNPGHGATTYLVTLGKGSESHRLAFSACQVLLTPPLQAALLSDDALLTELFQFAALPAPLPTARAGYFTNLVYQLLETDPARLASWLARGGILPKLLGHVENDSIRRLLCHRIDEVVPIGGQPSTDGGTRWLGLLGGGAMFPLMRTKGVDLASVLLEELGKHSSSEELAATAADACESWAATASKGPAAAEGAMHAGIAVDLLRAFHSELGATTLLSGLRDSESDPSSGAHTVLPLLSALVQVENTLDGSAHTVRWETTPLRTQLRSALPLLTGWLRPGSCGEASSWCSGAPRVGRLRHRVAVLLAALCGVGCNRFPSRGLQEATLDGAKLAESGALAAMVEALFAFPTASVLHSSLMQGFRLIIRQRDATTAALFRDGSGGTSGGGLFSAMTSVYAARSDAQNLRPPPQYYGYLEQLMTHARECRSIASECKSWEALCAAESASVSMPLDAQLEAVEEPVLHGAENRTGGVYKRYPGMQLQHEQLLANSRGSLKAMQPAKHDGEAMEAGKGDVHRPSDSGDMVDSPRIEESTTGGARLLTPTTEAVRQQSTNRSTKLLEPPLSPSVRGPGNDSDDDDNQWETVSVSSKRLSLPEEMPTSDTAVVDDTNLAVHSDDPSRPPVPPTMSATIVPKAGSVEPRGLRDSLTGDLMSVDQLRASTGKSSPPLAPLAGGGGAHGSPGIGGSSGGIGALPPLALPPIRLGGTTGSSILMDSAALPPPRLALAPLGSKPLDKGTNGDLVQNGEVLTQGSVPAQDSDCATQPKPAEEGADDSGISPGLTDDSTVVSHGDSSCNQQKEHQAVADRIEPPKREAQKQTRFCIIQ
eukprot:COSAG02_NODE_5489_length_4286_cov_7.114879_2_plen_905_part_00